MKVSINTIKQFTDVSLPVDQLVHKINTQLGGVEQITDLGQRYAGAIIVRIADCEKHPNADRLNICKIDDGSVVKGIDRDKDGFVQVVCGAPNVTKGMFAVWLPPKTTVPASFTEAELFVLESRELRGVVSNGMLASPKELLLGDSHDGILAIDPQEKNSSNKKITPGVSFAAIYGLDDKTIDIENKMFTHRPDCFGQLGVAREIAGIQHKTFSSPEWYTTLPEFSSGEGLELKVFNEAPKAVSRFMATTVKDVTVGPSPVWLQAELVRLGSKPINNVVDVTNYIMLLTGQPLHAYDYDKLSGRVLGARFADKDEKATLLNDKTYVLTTDDVVIVDDDTIVGLGGVMGGSSSEVSSSTKNIVLECATFDMYAIRRTSMRHGIFTEAVTRFNKGQSPLQNEFVLSHAMQLLLELIGGKHASQVFDIHGDDHIKAPKPVEVTDNFINDRLGLKLTLVEISTLLTNVEFSVKTIKKGKESLLCVTVPYWRTDIHLPEDIVEEVGRLYGFDKLPNELPARSVSPAPKNIRVVTKEAIRFSLARAGANEVLNYSFVHEKVLKNSGQDSSQAFRLSNALSPELQYFRLSLMPSLLDKVHKNIKNGFNEFALFEIGKGHDKSHIDDNGLPIETDLVEMIYASKAKSNGAPYYKVQRIASELAASLGVPITFERIETVLDYPGIAMYDQKRSSLVKNNVGATVGIVGELNQSVRKNFKLPNSCAAFSFDIEALESSMTSISSYQPLSKFPSVTQDISLKLPTSVGYAQLHEILTSLPTNFSVKSWPISIYQSKEDISTKTITFRVQVTSYDRTLAEKDVSVLLKEFEHSAKKLGAVRS